MEGKKLKCSNCNSVCGQENIFFDHRGYGYSAKLLKCPECGKITILKYYIDNIDINNDQRYYD